MPTAPLTAKTAADRPYVEDATYLVVDALIAELEASRVATLEVGDLERVAQSPGKAHFVGGRS